MKYCTPPRYLVKKEGFTYFYIAQIIVVTAIAIATVTVIVVIVVLVVILVIAVRVITTAIVKLNPEPCPLFVGISEYTDSGEQIRKSNCK